MIPRRQFLGAVTAGCFACGATIGPLLKHALAQPTSETTDLNWRCDVIQTVAHDRAQRNPVVTGVCLQPQGSLLAIVGDDHHVNLYDTQQRTYVDHIDVHNDWIRATQFTSDGKRLVTAGNDRMLCVWDSTDWTAPLFTRKHEAAIIEVAISHDNQKFATVGFEKTTRVYDVARGMEVAKFECPCDDNHAVAFSPADDMIATGGRSGVLTIWNLATGLEVTRVKAHRQRIRSIAFTPDGKIISASDDQRVCITNLANPQTPITLPRLASKLYSTELLADGLFATGGSNNKIQIWQLSTQKELGTLSGHTGTVSCLDYADRKLASGSFDTQVRLWSTESQTSILVDRQTKTTDGWNSRPSQNRFN